MDIKAVPNILSIARVVFAVLLLFIEPASALFYVTYFVCGITDVLDGAIARGFDAVSKTGKILDLVGDIVFTIVILILLFRLFVIPVWIIVWVVIIAIARVAALLISYARLRTTFTHSYLDRIAGVVLFLLVPLTLMLNLDFAITAGVTCAVATLATIEVLAISTLMKQAVEGVYSIFQVNDTRHFY